MTKRHYVELVVSKMGTCPSIPELPPYAPRQRDDTTIETLVETQLTKIKIWPFLPAAVFQG